MGVKTESIGRTEAGASPRAFEDGTVQGLEKAVQYARSGRIISAIKHLEAVNPELTREQAKALVRSFDCVREARWPEQLRLPVRCL